MTTTPSIAAHVRGEYHPTRPDHRPRRTYRAEVLTVDEHGTSRITVNNLTFTEAIETALRIRAQEDQRLMDEVHASRATRRSAMVTDPRCSRCHRLEIDHLGTICPDSTSSDIHTMEATA